MKATVNPTTGYLRNNSSISEICLWAFLKEKKMMGYEFRRQRYVDQFIVDFYCSKLRLAISLDGYVNASKKDAMKEKRLNELGIKVLRFNDREVSRDITSVLKKIEGFVKSMGGMQFRFLF